MTITYHYPKNSQYTSTMCGQWSLYTELKISKVGVTCKKCLKKLAKQGEKK